jgi:hypothetical protein
MLHLYKGRHHYIHQLWIRVAIIHPVTFYDNAQPLNQSFSQREKERKGSFVVVSFLIYLCILQSFLTLSLSLMSFSSMMSAGASAI